MSGSLLVRVCATYCHPNADTNAYDSLKRLARRPEDAEMARFKVELRRALTIPGTVPPDLFAAIRYSDGSPRTFLSRLWNDLYPGEPI